MSYFCIAINGDGMLNGDFVALCNLRQDIKFGVNLGHIFFQDFN